jgi:hypothetical protein
MWAYDISGGDNAQKVWNDNNWNQNDALVGFYPDNSYNIIFCEPGYAVYVLGNYSFDKPDFIFHNQPHATPPVILINLNNAYDTSFIHHKLYEMPPVDINEERFISDITTHIPKNQLIIDFLVECVTCFNNQDNKSSYINAINQIGALWSEISKNDLETLDIESSIKDKIAEVMKEIP